MKGWKEEKVVPCKTNEWFAEGKECRAINSTVATMRGFTSHGARRTQERHGTIAPISKVVGYLTAGGAGGSTKMPQHLSSTPAVNPTPVANKVL